MNSRSLQETCAIHVLPYGFFMCAKCMGAGSNFVLHRTIEDLWASKKMISWSWYHFAFTAEEANNEGSDFYILVCEESFQALEDDKKVDNCGQVVFWEEHIVDGSHYKNN